jgi:hypothetical protein
MTILWDILFGTWEGGVVGGIKFFRLSAVVMDRVEVEGQKTRQIAFAQPSFSDTQPHYLPM